MTSLSLRPSLSIAAILTLAIVQSTNAANPHVSKADPALVRKALMAEAESKDEAVDRRDLLRPDLQPDAATSAAWWQSGFVKRGQSWHPVGTPLSAAELALNHDYRSQRDAAPKTAEGQLKLANWCRDHHLVDAERAHLAQAAELAPNAPESATIYRRLGYRQVGNDWVSTKTLQDQQRLNRQNAADLRAWQTAAERIARNWVGSPKQQTLAIEELKEIQTPKAIPALLMIAPANESLTLAICKQIDKLHSFEASQALAMIAICAPWSSVRETAAEALQDHKLDYFVPSLLAEMRTPYRAVTTSRQVAAPRIYVREESDRYFAVDVQMVPVMTSVEAFPATNGSNPFDARRITATRRRNDLARATETIDYDLARQIEQVNDVAGEYNDRAAAILSKVSGQEPSLDPKYWWAWWCLHTGTVPPPKKCQVQRQQVPIEVQGVRTIAVRHSCLIAGTLIATDVGDIAIEKIQIGDRVLAKDLATGEIDYKPVLQTTVREPVPVRRFHVNGTSITASSGHHFWVSGDGWTKTRELEVGHPIHTATGMSRVASVEDEPTPAPVYNLVVADFHTYFVGKAMVLSHDVTPPAPTNTKVPGLDDLPNESRN